MFTVCRLFSLVFQAPRSRGSVLSQGRPFCGFSAASGICGSSACFAPPACLAYTNSLPLLTNAHTWFPQHPITKEMCVFIPAAHVCRWRHTQTHLMSDGSGERPLCVTAFCWWFKSSLLSTWTWDAVQRVLVGWRCAQLTVSSYSCHSPHIAVAVIVLSVLCWFEQMNCCTELLSTYTATGIDNLSVHSVWMS